MTAAFEGGAEGGAPVRTEPPLAVGDLAETAAVAPGSPVGSHACGLPRTARESAASGCVALTLR